MTMGENLANLSGAACTLDTLATYAVVNGETQLAESLCMVARVLRGLGEDLRPILLRDAMRQAGPPALVVHMREADHGGH